MSKTFNQVKLNVNFTAISPSSNMSNIESDDNISETFAKIHHWYVKTNGFQASASPLVSTSSSGIVNALPSATGGFLKNTGTTGGTWTTIGSSDLPSGIVYNTGNVQLNGLFEPSGAGDGSQITTSNGNTNMAQLGRENYPFSNIYGVNIHAATKSNTIKPSLELSWYDASGNNNGDWKFEIEDNTNGLTLSENGNELFNFDTDGIFTCKSLSVTTINGKVVGNNPKFTDTVTTVTSDGSTGNAITNVTASNGQLTLSKGSFLPSTTTYAASDTVGGDALVAKRLIAADSNMTEAKGNLHNIHPKLGVTLNGGYGNNIGDGWPDKRYGLLNVSIDQNADSYGNATNTEYGFTLGFYTGSDNGTLYDAHLLYRYLGYNNGQQYGTGEWKTLLTDQDIVQGTNISVTSTNWDSRLQDDNHIKYAKKVTISHETINTSASTASSSLSFGGTFTSSYISSMDNGHVEAYKNSTFTLPSLPDGTTSQKGIVKLSSSTSSTSTSLAATPSAVKSAYDLANNFITGYVNNHLVEISYFPSYKKYDKSGSTPVVREVFRFNAVSSTSGVTITECGCVFYRSTTATSDEPDTQTLSCELLKTDANSSTGVTLATSNFTNKTMYSPSIAYNSDTISIFVRPWFDYTYNGTTYTAYGDIIRANIGAGFLMDSTDGCWRNINESGYPKFITEDDLGSAAYTSSTAYASSSHTHSYIPLTGSSNVTGNLEITKATGAVGFYATRSDTDVRVYFGVGDGGTAEGIYSYTSGGWVFKNDGGNTSIPRITGKSIKIGGITVPTSTGSFLVTGNTSFSGSLTSGTKIGTITIGGTATDLYCQTNTDEKVKTTAVTSTTDSAAYRPIFSNGSGTASAYISEALKIGHQVGTASAEGNVRLILGNNTAKGTAGNQSGWLRMYGPGTGYVTLAAPNTSSNSYVITLPAATGTIALTSDIPTAVSFTCTSANTTNYKIDKQRCYCIFGKFVVINMTITTSTTFAANTAYSIATIPSAYTAGSGNVVLGTGHYQVGSPVTPTVSAWVTGTSIKFSTTTANNTSSAKTIRVSFTYAMS